MNSYIRIVTTQCEGHGLSQEYKCRYLAYRDTEVNNNNNNNKVTTRIRKNLEAMPRKHSIDSPQKTAILGTSHIIW
jgi:hypothetical protein